MLSPRLYLRLVIVLATGTGFFVSSVRSLRSIHMGGHMVSEISPIQVNSCGDANDSGIYRQHARPQDGPLIRTNETDDVAIPMEMTSVLPHLLIHFTK